jgi:hypothetical protein
VQTEFIFDELWSMPGVSLVLSQAPWADGDNAIKNRAKTENGRSFIFQV